jgi:hypothetical protein
MLLLNLLDTSDTSTIVIPQISRKILLVGKMLQKRGVISVIYTKNKQSKFKLYVNKTLLRVKKRSMFENKSYRFCNSHKINYSPIDQ